MILLGGLTRLTDSGLSITEWKPLTGVLPPFNETSWINEFLKYSKTSEFKLQNINMTLQEFKVIYYWEWAHRQLGRLIGLVWFLGFFLFLVWHKVSSSWRTRFLILGFLIGLQGFLGWWMVSSGLKNMMVDVASYRLAVHLTTAFAIFGLIFWYTLKGWVQLIYFLKKHLLIYLLFFLLKFCSLFNIFYIAKMVKNYSCTI